MLWILTRSTSPRASNYYPQHMYLWSTGDSFPKLSSNTVDSRYLELQGTL